MNVLVFGADSQVGRRICQYAHSDGHSVTAFVQETETAPSDVTVVEGVFDDTATVVEAVGDTASEYDVVCSAVGTDSEVWPTLIGSLEALVGAIEHHSIDRLVAVATTGILQATPDRLRLDTDEFPDEQRSIARAQQTLYERLRKSALDWTLVCPPTMPDGTPTNHYRTAVDYLPDGGQSVSTGDVAAFVYEAAVGGTHHRERVGIAY